MPLATRAHMDTIAPANMKKNHSFQAEVAQVLHLVVHSLYSNKEIFLRELVSNASDAIDKLRFRAVTEPDLLKDEPALEIRIRPDAEAKAIRIEDTGCGMTEDELVEFLGTVAHSGSRALLEKITQGGEAKALSLIGQFGVGFYSAFLVADRVEVVSRAAGAEGATRWISEAKEGFTTEPAERATRGTEITLFLKPEHEEFLESWRLRELVLRYSDYVRYPIFVERKGKDNARELEQVNRASALWQRPRSEITDEQYNELYKHIAHDAEEPLARTHFRIEGNMEFVGLLYLPRHPPFDLYDPSKRRGVRLFVKRVLILDDCAELLPPHLRFLRGIIDSDDLPLNVSRELLQDSSVLRAIKKQVTKKALEMLEDLAKERPDDYATFTRTFGAVLKEGAATGERDEKLAALFRFDTTRSDKLSSLDEYVERMPEEQKAVYYLHGGSREALGSSPYLEALAKKGFEVLLMSDPVDEFAVSGIREWKGKKLVSAMQADLDLDSTEEEKKAREEHRGKLSALVARASAVLEGRVKEVRLSDRLTDSPACLVLGPGGTPAYIESMLRAAGRPVPPSPRILELNATHPLVEKLGLRADNATNDEALTEFIEVLYDQAKLAEGSPIDNPSLYARRVASLLALGA